MSSDIEIARQAKPKPIGKIAEKCGIPDNSLHTFGRHKAKVDLDYLDGLSNNPDTKLILVTGITPTPAGEGKTTTTVGLGDALNKIGKKATICLREPSLGPCFGIKGGAAGGAAAEDWLTRADGSRGQQRLGSDRAVAGGAAAAEARRGGGGRGLGRAERRAGGG